MRGSRSPGGHREHRRTVERNPTPDFSAFPWTAFSPCGASGRWSPAPLPPAGSPSAKRWSCCRQARRHGSGHQVHNETMTEPRRAAAAVNLQDSTGIPSRGARCWRGREPSSRPPLRHRVPVLAGQEKAQEPHNGPFTRNQRDHGRILLPEGMELAPGRQPRQFFLENPVWPWPGTATSSKLFHPSHLGRGAIPDPLAGKQGPWGSDLRSRDPGVGGEASGCPSSSTVGLRRSGDQRAGGPHGIPEATLRKNLESCSRPPGDLRDREVWRADVPDRP